jgi:endo-1,4-beta-xylanase
MPNTRRDFCITSATLALSACSTQSVVEAPEVITTETTTSNTLPRSMLASDPALPSLSKALAPHFPFGSAITPGQVLMGNSELIKKHFSVAVAENAMKPVEISKTGEGIYDFDAADSLVNFCIANGIKVRGHTLIWHQQTPPWLFYENGKIVNKKTLISRMEKYITDVVTHFKGRVYAWDVVNEAFSFNNEAGVRTDANGMRMSRFREVIGPEYIEIAFRAAAAADPDTLLFYNDYETQNPPKVAAISAMVREFKSRGVKIDGIGHQAHCSVTHPSIEAFEDSIVEYAKLGVTQHITELDIALNGDIMKNNVPEATPELLDLQGKRYGDFFKLFIKHKDKITAVLVWGIDDNNTWLKSWPMKRFEAPLIFDEKQLTKPAFWSIIEASNQI